MKRQTQSLASAVGTAAPRACTLSHPSVAQRCVKKAARARARGETYEKCRKAPCCFPPNKLVVVIMVVGPKAVLCSPVVLPQPQHWVESHSTGLCVPNPTLSRGREEMADQSAEARSCLIRLSCISE